MKAVPQWRRVLRHAWSIRLAALAGVLSAAEAYFGYVDPNALPIPHGTFAVLASVTSGAALCARLFAQRHLSGDR